MAGKRIDAIAYLRTSSAANVGSDKDSDKRQRAAIASFAKAHGYRIVDEFYDAAVSGADPVAERPGFKAMLDRIAGQRRAGHPGRESRQVCQRPQRADHRARLPALARGRVGADERAPLFHDRYSDRSVGATGTRGRQPNLRRRTWSPN
jgi:Resolvase, N terminal domain